MYRGIAWLGFWSATFAAASAGAWPYQLRVRSLHCGDAADLGARVQRRLMRPEPENWTFAVGIDSAPGETIATITSVGPNGATETRSVHGAQCESVLDAAALVIAVTLDPSLAQPRPELRTSPAARREEGAPASWHLGARAGGGARSAIANTLGWELSLGAVVVRQARLGSELAVDYVHGRGRITSADLTLDAGRLYLVPMRFEFGPSLSLSPAVGAEIGRLTGSPTLELVGGRSEGGLWATVGLQSTLTLSTGALGPGVLDVSLTPFVARPLKRDTFEASANEQTLYKVPRWDLGARAGLTFWLG